MKEAPRSTMSQTVKRNRARIPAGSPLLKNTKSNPDSIARLLKIGVCVDKAAMSNPQRYKNRFALKRTKTRYIRIISLHIHAFPITNRSAAIELARGLSREKLGTAKTRSSRLPHA